MTAGPPCIRCGDFVTEEKTTLPGLALCSPCLDAGVEPAGRVVFPNAVVKARLKYLAVLLPLMGLAFAAPFAVLDAPANFFVGLFALVTVELVFIALTFSRIHHAGHDTWKREVRAKLSLPAELVLPFVLYVPKRPRFWSLAIFFDAAFLAETEDGFVLIGEKTRTVLRLAAASRVSTERIVMNPPRTCMKIDLADGPRYVAFIEKGTFKENRRLAEECAERAEARRRALHSAGR
ncbi:MAG: hypothetical protein ACAI25_02105 [Planctomycetota bacterium]